MKAPTDVQATWRKFGWTPPSEGKEMKNWLQSYIEEEAHTQYCPYCVTSRNEKLSCCGESDWIEFKDLDFDTQISIAQEEWETAFKK